MVGVVVVVLVVATPVVVGLVVVVSAGVAMASRSPVWWVRFSPWSREGAVAGGECVRGRFGSPLVPCLVGVAPCGRAVPAFEAFEVFETTDF